MEFQKRLEHRHPVRVDADKLEAAAAFQKRFAGIRIRAIAYDMRGFFHEVLEKYFKHLGKAAADSKPVVIPFIDDHQIPTEDFESKSEGCPNGLEGFVRRQVRPLQFITANV